MIEHIGFTGTRTGMTKPQLASVRMCFVDLVEQGARVFHHGDCVGADVEAYWIARDFELLLVAHPGAVKSQYRAMTVNDERREPGYPLDRNKDIVNESDVMIAAPARNSQRRGGTWFTIKYARREDKPLFVVHANGIVEATP